MWRHWREKIFQCKLVFRNVLFAFVSQKAFKIIGISNYSTFNPSTTKTLIFRSRTLSGFDEALRFCTLSVLLEVPSSNPADRSRCEVVRARKSPIFRARTYSGTFSDWAWTQVQPKKSGPLIQFSISETKITKMLSILLYQAFLIQQEMSNHKTGHDFGRMVTFSHPKQAIF